MGSVATALRVDQVTKRYGDFVAVSQLSFEIPTGTIYGILGPNGAGKTTTLRMVNDILAPDEGDPAGQDLLRERAVLVGLHHVPHPVGIRGGWPGRRAQDAAPQLCIL